MTTSNLCSKKPLHTETPNVVSPEIKETPESPPLMASQNHLSPLFDHRSMPSVFKLSRRHYAPDMKISPSTQVVLLVALPICTKPPVSKSSALVPSSPFVARSKRQTYLRRTQRIVFLPDISNSQRGCKVLQAPFQSSRHHKKSHLLRHP